MLSDSNTIFRLNGFKKGGGVRSKFLKGGCEVKRGNLVKLLNFLEKRGPLLEGG